MQLNQKGAAQRKLAELLLSIPAGECLPTFERLHEWLGVGTGTIQKAIDELTASDAIEIEARQRYGTTLRSKDIRKLWRYLPDRHLTGLLPEPLSPETRGLAMGLREAFARFDISLVIVYGYGSSIRFDRIIDEGDKGDFVISSRASVECQIDRGRDLDLELSFGPYSYYQRDSLVVLSHEACSTSDMAIKVCLDERSFDQATLTRKLFPSATYIETDYADIPFAVISGCCDVAVWHRNVPPKLLASSTLFATPVREIMPSCSLEMMSEAVLSINRSNHLVAGIAPNLDVELVQSVQHGVLSQQLRPIF